MTEEVSQSYPMNPLQGKHANETKEFLKLLALDHLNASLSVELRSANLLGDWEAEAEVFVLLSAAQASTAAS